MNLSYHFKKIILLICLFGFYLSSCEPFPELPQETQSGKGSFGCLVNNELVFAWANSNSFDVQANYDLNADQLQISAKCQFGQRFLFILNNPYEKQNTLIDTLRYSPPDSGEWLEAFQTGYFKISRIDSNNDGFDVVSGTFFFDLNVNEKAPIHVNKGRFDLNLSTN